LVGRPPTAGERAWATPNRAQSSVNYWMLPVVKQLFLSITALRTLA
jgi:hypothetical protein